MGDSSNKPKRALDDVIEFWKTSCLDEAEPPSKTTEDLKVDAKTFFRYISKNTELVTDSKVVLQTKSSHEDALAQLIRDLGPAFKNEHHKSRLRALHILLGGIEGCKGAQLSNKMVKLLGSFLRGHCGPIDDDDDDGEDYDTLIRDAAVLGLSSLVGASTIAGSTIEERREALILRMDLARDGVNRRCAAPDLDQATSDPYGFGAPTEATIGGGLSTMPRSKRALCFDLLQSAVSGIDLVAKQEESASSEISTLELQAGMVEFARLTANCLHGESDPRCLLQLLKLIHSTQVVLHPFFVDWKNRDTIFPTEDIFDAVAAYFPIQFTPPPNNIHGITREGLHSALIAVLTYIKYDTIVVDMNDRQPMINLSADLFLEQLLPTAEDSPGPLDKAESLECLSALLFQDAADSQNMLEKKLDTRITKSLSEALKHTHDESSLGASQGGQMGLENKNLADQCRTFVAKLAFKFEKISIKLHWNLFVTDHLKRLSSKVKMSPARAKTSIAYIACLASSGGSHTLRACLDTGIVLLMEYLEQKMDETEDTLVATNGIGALCSSCRAAIDRANTQGVVLHPHPMESYSEKVATILLRVFEKTDFSTSIRVAAARALECFLFAVAADQLSENTFERLCSFLTVMSEKINSVATDDLGVDLIETFATVLGNVLGGVLDCDESSPTDALIHNKPLVEFMTNKIYPALLARNAETSFDSERYDLKALSIASSSSSKVAVPVMASCLDLLNNSLVENGIRSSRNEVHAQAVAYLLHNGGKTAIDAFHYCPIVDTILMYFDDFAKARSTTNSNIRLSVADLALPETDEERESFKTDMTAARNLMEQLLTAYEQHVPVERVVQLLEKVSPILPPLSQADSFRLCLWLPILGASLHAIPYKATNSDDLVTLRKSLASAASTLLDGLSDFAISHDVDVDSRAAAASCLHAVVVRLPSDKECPVIPIIKTRLNPLISTSIDFATTKNSLSILALIGSAAASRGGSSSTTADKIVRFLVEVACKGRSVLPFSAETDQYFITSSFDQDLELELSAAAAYGSIISVKTLKPLKKQRLTHSILKYMKEAHQKEQEAAQAGENLAATRIGLLATVCHVVCSCDLARFDHSTVQQISSMVIEGLSSSLFNQSNAGAGAWKTVAKNLVLAANLKVLCLVPDLPKNFILSIITGLLRAYAVSDPVSEISCKMLALQGLEQLSHLEGLRSSTLDIKPAVVAVLAAAMNHPSGLLRQAAVDVRNAWYVLS